MKIIKLSILFGLFLMIFSCNKKAADHEPNNNISEASEIVLGQEFAIKISPVGDIDWFKVDIKEQGYLKVQSLTEPADVKLEVGFALYEEWEAEKEKWLRKWKKLPDALFISKAGTYYFAIIDDYNDAETKKEVKIKANFIKEFDPTEPNNSPQEAVELEIAKASKIAIFPVGDVDWIKVNAQKQGYLKVSAKDFSKDLVLEIRFCKYDEWSDPKISVIRNWKKLPDACFVPDSGDYYIYLHDNYNDQASEKPFNLKIDFLDEIDIYEPNNQFNKAKRVNRGDTLNIAIFPQKDLDYFKINVLDGNKIKFLASEIAEVEVELRLFVVDPNDDSKYIVKGKWKKAPAEYDVTPGQEYFILIHDSFDDDCVYKNIEIKIE
ncbi:MAG: hypothetical protein PF487_12270 [Bacteroidales bacterium]|jgi:phage anti-repressor protein|nr:hypothetical protein [Bacteroidales bacterium]